MQDRSSIFSAGSRNDKVQHLTDSLAITDARNGTYPELQINRLCCHWNCVVFKYVSFFMSLNYYYAKPVQYDD
jgi:hypothetical protein